jgi:hypothetical protein
MKTSDLIPDNKNANKGTARGRKAVASSLKRYGAGRSILIDRDNRIIAGNKTAEGAQDMPVRIVETDGTELIAVKRTDLSLDDATGKELAIADNRTAELGLEWDADILKDIATEADLMPFFDSKEIAKLCGEREETESVGEIGDLRYQVIIECRDEAHQAELLSRFDAEGLGCKALIV